MDVDDLRAAVEREFAVTGADTPPWPNPHEGLAGPREEEYSRLLDPQKYRIVAARAQAWARALVTTGLAAREPVQEPATVWEHARRHDDFARPAEHGTWVRPVTAGAVPLLFALRSAQTPDDHLDIGAGDPAERIVDIPDCGCDACDSGSADLLTHIDDTVLAVVTGEFVHVRFGETTVVGLLDGCSSASGSGGLIASHSAIDTALADVRAGRWTGPPAIHGPPWF